MYRSRTQVALFQDHNDPIAVKVHDYDGQHGAEACVGIDTTSTSVSIHAMSVHQIIDLGERIARAGRELSARRDEAARTKEAGELASV